MGKWQMIPVTSDGLNLAVVSLERNVESNNSVAGLDQVQVLLRDVCLRGSSVEEELDLFKESGFLELIISGSIVLRIKWVLLASSS